MATTLTALNYAMARVLDGRPVMVVAQTNAQGFTSGTIAKMQWQQVYRDTDRGFDLDPDTYTVNTAGWYHVSARVHWAAQSGGIRFAQLRQNNLASITVIANRSASTQVTTAYVDSIVSCEVGDTMQLWAQQNSGSTINTYVTSLYNSLWSMTWISGPQ